MINNGQTLEIEYDAERSEELGRRMEDDEAVESPGRSRHRRSVVPARSERSHAEHAFSGQRSLGRPR